MSHGPDRWLGLSNIACWVTKFSLDRKFESPNGMYLSRRLTCSSVEARKNGRCGSASRRSKVKLSYPMPLAGAIIEGRHLEY